MTGANDKVSFCIRNENSAYYCANVNWKILWLFKLYSVGCSLRVKREIIKRPFVSKMSPPWQAPELSHQGTKGLKGHCHEHNFKNSTAQKHCYMIGNLLTTSVY